MIWWVVVYVTVGLLIAFLMENHTLSIGQWIAVIALWPLWIAVGLYAVLKRG